MMKLQDKLSPIVTFLLMLLIVFGLGLALRARVSIEEISNADTNTYMSQGDVEAADQPSLSLSTVEQSNTIDVLDEDFTQNYESIPKEVEQNFTRLDNTYNFAGISISTSNIVQFNESAFVETCIVSNRPNEHLQPRRVSLAYGEQSSDNPLMHGNPALQADTDCIVLEFDIQPNPDLAEATLTVYELVPATSIEPEAQTCAIYENRMQSSDLQSRGIEIACEQTSNAANLSITSYPQGMQRSEAEAALSQVLFPQYNGPWVLSLVPNG